MTDGQMEQAPATLYGPADLAAGARAWRALKAGLKSPASFIAAEGSDEDGIDRMWTTLVWCAVMPVLAVNGVLAFLSGMLSFVRFNDEQPMAILAATPMWLGFSIIAAWLGGYLLRGGLQLGGAKVGDAADKDIVWTIAAGAFAIPIWVFGLSPSLFELVRRMGVPMALLNPLLMIVFLLGCALALRHIFMVLFAWQKERDDASMASLILGGGGFAIAWFAAGVFPMIFTLAFFIDKFD